jgi:DNA polymerase III delta subunit
MLIIHGDDTTKSRLFLNQQIDTAKKKGISIIRLEAKNLDITNLTQHLESSSLFQEDKTIIIFSPFSLPQSAKKSKLFEYLKQNQDKNITLYQDKPLTAPILKQFPNSQTQIFKINPLIFSFLESLKPGNSIQTLKIYFNLERQEPAEMIFAMFIRQIRLLITTKFSPEKLNLAPWQKTRLINQAKNFIENDLLNLHQELYQIDKDIKTGANSTSLTLRLQNLILNI